jgi:hypothetical protein
VEGLLQQVNAHSERKFYVYDTLTDRKVPCTFGEALSGAVKEALYDRVSVHGNVRYDADGRPISVKAEQVTRFAPMAELPQFFQIPPMDITGGVDPADYIEELYEDA